MKRRPATVRKLHDRAMKGLAVGSSAMGIFFLGWILWTVIMRGVQAINFDFFTELPVPPGVEGGGLANAILGTLIMTAIATVIGVPVGIVTGVFLSEVGKGTKLASAVRFAINLLMGVPSIIVGLFVYTVLVLPVGHFSGYAGAVALAFIMLPVVARTTDDMLNLVPNALRESALGPGASPLAGHLRGGLPGRPHRHGDRRASGGGACERGDGAALVHLPQQRLLARVPVRAHGQHDRDHLQLRHVPVPGLAAGGVGRVPAHHDLRARGDHLRPLAHQGEEEMISNLAVKRESEAPVAPPVPVPARSGGPREGAREDDRIVAVEDAKISVRDLSFFYGEQQALFGNSLDIATGKVTAIIGPSGCGKSTHIRVYNRIFELYRDQRAKGQVLLDGVNLLSRSVDLIELRRRVGMIFQKPTPFPMTVFDNIAYGLKMHYKLSRSETRDRVEEALRQAALWDEVKDKLNKPGMALSGGQQQRLCIARAIAVEPEVLLMDEPTSAVDPVATARIEELVESFKGRYTVAIVTHNMQQAARISDNTAFFFEGNIVEFGPTSKIFTNPEKKQTEDYITGRFG